MLHVQWVKNLRKRPAIINILKCAASSDLLRMIS